MNLPLNPTAIGPLTSFGVFVSFAAMFAVPSGYSYGAVLLLLTSLWWLTSRRAGGWDLNGQDRLMLAMLVIYSVIPSLMTALLGNNPTDYDQYSRALLAIPVLLLLLHVPVRLSVLWAGIIVGIVLSAPLAWWQVYFEGWARAPGFLNIIHFSNLCLVFTVFCVGGLYWAGQQPRHAGRWRAAFLLGIVCGLYSVIMGGSRGSWVALPPVIVVFMIAFLNRRNIGRLALIGALGAVLVAVLFAVPGSPLKARYERGVQDISQYEHDDTDTSIGARFEMWRGAWKNMQVHPVAGWNVQAYTQALKDQVSAGELTQIAVDYNDNLHNNYLQAWVFTGLPGLLALLVLYAVPLWQFARRLKAAEMTVRILAFCGTSVVVSYLCFGLTQVILRRNNGIMFYLLAVLVFWGAIRQAERLLENR